MKNKKFKIANNTLSRAVKKGLVKLRTKSEAGKLGHIKHPQKHTEESKNKLSVIRKKYLSEHPDKVPYLINHYSKGESYPEKYFNNIFEKENIKFERYYRIGLYELDFAFLNQKIDLEIDGEQHKVDNRILESDIRRDEFMKENGWKIIRIDWKNYSKLKTEDKKKYIEKLLNEIKDLKLT